MPFHLAAINRSTDLAEPRSHRSAATPQEATAKAVELASGHPAPNYWIRIITPPGSEAAKASMWEAMVLMDLVAEVV